MNNPIHHAIQVARAENCKDATFGFLRHAKSLSQTTVGGSTDLPNPSMQEIRFNLTARSKDSTDFISNLLNEADGFIITHFRISLLQVLTGKTPQKSQPQFFANPDVFDGTQVDAIRELYNGKFFVKSGSKVLNQGGWPMTAFSRSGAFNEGQDVATGIVLNASAQPDGLYGAVPVFPELRIGGVNKTEVIIELPESISLISPTATTETVLVLDTYGVIAPGMADVYNGMFLVP